MVIDPIGKNKDNDKHKMYRHAWKSNTAKEKPNIEIEKGHCYAHVIE